MMRDFLREWADFPVIAAVGEEEKLALALQSPVRAVFFLGGIILTLPRMVALARDHKKRVFLHMDLVDGLGRDDAAVEWCAQMLRPDGLISTRPSLIRSAAQMGICTIQRLFLMDSASFEHGKRLLKGSPADMVEVLPGIAPKAIAELKRAIDKPVIAGGLVTQWDEVERALEAGAAAVSAGTPALWRNKG